MKSWNTFLQLTTKDDKVEIVATALATFILGGSFAKDLFTNGTLELRIFFFGLSSYVLLFAISFIAEIKVKLFRRNKILMSLFWIVFFTLGTQSALNLFMYQFIEKKPDLDIQAETLIFLTCYTVSTNILYVINKEVLQEALRRKTIYKYLLAPLNGLSFGIIFMGGIVWLIN